MERAQNASPVHTSSYLRFACLLACMLFTLENIRDIAETSISSRGNLSLLPPTREGSRWSILSVAGLLQGHYAPSLRLMSCEPCHDVRALRQVSCFGSSVAELRARSRSRLLVPARTDESEYSIGEVRWEEDMVVSGTYEVEGMILL